MSAKLPIIKEPHPQPLPAGGYPLPGSFLTFVRVFTQAFITLIGSLFILNKNAVLARILKANLSSMPNYSVSKTAIEHRFQDCKERCD